MSGFEDGSAEHPRVALLGAGRMGQAILAGLLQAGWPPERLVAADAHAPTAARVRDSHGIRVVEGIAEAVTGADLVLVAVKPDDVPGALAEAAAAMPAGTTVLSIAAGVPTRALAAHLPSGTPVVRAMPNTPALIGLGMSVVSAGSDCPTSSVALAERVLGAVGEVREVPEWQQDAVTAVSGSGPAYVFAVAEAMIDAGVHLGLPRPLARDLTVHTLIGAATMLRDSGEHPAVLRENVTSPGGTTAAALHVLEELAVKAAFTRAMRAARDRSEELAGD
ncbi:MAG: pyrroline-5-carboxylate reductase [Candidatus Nanopelagicales bacterium]|jgi:pyrroline-5-carboxylate reductase|nr:pyrroline-5-carboxylate reductase [Candidatus Nanopelagicales bacterium]